jgi:hypothetical protein
MQILSDKNANPGRLVQSFGPSACKHPDVTAGDSSDQQNIRRKFADPLPQYAREDYQSDHNFSGPILKALEKVQ